MSECLPASGLATHPPPRVWSVVVTIFGDAVLPRGGAIRLSALQRIAERLGIEPTALRAAMSRLVRDGWAQRDRRGRESVYRLSPDRLREVTAASTRIYRVTGPKWDGRWTVLIAPDPLPETLAARGFGRIAAGVWLRPETAGMLPLPAGTEALVINGHANDLAPARAIAQAAWPLADAAGLYRDLIERWQGYTLTPDTAPLDALAARTLLIHDWRRAVLKDPDLPDPLRPADWPGFAARELVARLYPGLWRASEPWLDEPDIGPDGQLPPSDAAATRFVARSRQDNA